MLAVALAGCSPGPRVGGRADAAGGASSFEVLSKEVFMPTCATSECHAGNPPPRAPMSLEAGQTWAALVDAPSYEVPSLRRVAPGDVPGSYLMHKLRGTAESVGGIATRMPLGQPMLQEEQLLAIEDWISQGAPR